jgi:glycosyltransferase involved in cell wall biosynthesis
MKLSVIVPVYNERRTIDILLEKVRGVDIEKEIIIVDGNSMDGTKALLKMQEKKPDTLVIYQSAKTGRGSAIKEGLRLASGDIVIFQDADLELDPNDYPSLIAPIMSGAATVVFGSRFKGRKKPKMGLFQYWGNKVINFAVNVLYGTRLTDVETCYQVFRREAIKDMVIRNNDFAFTVELTVKLIKKGYEILEIPITYYPRGREEGKKIYWKDGLASLWTLIQYKFLD